jgi:hypothetical protein
MRLFGMKYVRPLAYMGTKVFANAFHSVLVPRMPRIHPACHIEPGNARERIRTVAQSAPQVFETQPAPVREREYVPYTPKPYVSRPAAVKRNGGLRGSTATRWKR